MSIFHIKLLAILTMAIDHIGAFLFPEVFILRIIGRFSFLLFAWLLANGAIHTKNSTAYLKRLFLFAIISQVPYLLVHGVHSPGSLELNIFFTLFLGLLAIITLQRLKNRIVKVLLVVCITLVAEQFTSGFSYGAYGVISILIFYLFYKNITIAVVLQALAIFVFYTLPVLLSGSTLSQLYDSRSIALIQPVALLSLFIIAFHNGKLGHKTKMFFYIFYPLHLTIIYLLMAFYF